MRTTPLRGMGLIDVILAIALMIIVFGALFGVLRSALVLSTIAKNKITAAELASTQIEYLRSLPYSSLGTEGGSPSGTVPPTSTVVINGTAYMVGTTISYRDDGADGNGPGDANGIATDYKVGRVTVTYPTHATSSVLTVTSNFAPSGIETSP